MRYNEIRRKTREIAVGNVLVGGNHPIAIQSMTNTDPHDAKATLDQIVRLRDAGCDIVRITVPDLEAVKTVEAVKKADTGIPVVADIHFDYKIAIACAEAGVDKIRINPGNIGSRERIEKVCRACEKRHIPIRIGVNSGSLEKDILARYGHPCPEALCESALANAAALEEFGFSDIVLSIKASNVRDMILANRLVAKETDYPLHLGVTEAGDAHMGQLKSAAGIGSLLCDGIGDTIRVSLTADPVLEVRAAKDILKALETEGQSGLRVVSCPTCGRTKIDLIGLVSLFEERVRAEKLDTVPLKVALMGCVVNGPGEAREADIGVAGGCGEAVLFSHGEILGKIPEDRIVETLIKEIKKRF